MHKDINEKITETQLIETDITNSNSLICEEIDADSPATDYTIKEAAEKSRMSVSWWRLLIYEKKIKYRKLGRRVFIPRSTYNKVMSDAVIEPK